MHAGQRRRRHHHLFLLLLEALYLSLPHSIVLILSLSLSLWNLANLPLIGFITRERLRLRSSEDSSQGSRFTACQVFPPLDSSFTLLTIEWKFFCSLCPGRSRLSLCVTLIIIWSSLVHVHDCSYCSYCISILCMRCMIAVSELETVESMNYVLL